MSSWYIAVPTGVPTAYVSIRDSTLLIFVPLRSIAVPTGGSPAHGLIPDSDSLLLLSLLLLPTRSILLRTYQIQGIIFAQTVGTDPVVQEFLTLDGAKRLRLAVST